MKYRETQSISHKQKLHNEYLKHNLQYLVHCHAEFIRYTVME